MQSESVIERCKLVDGYLSEGMSKKDAYKKAKLSGSLYYTYLQDQGKSKKVKKTVKPKFVDLVQPSKPNNIAVIVCSAESIKSVLAGLL
jgi:hypothetical protein